MPDGGVASELGRHLVYSQVGQTMIILVRISAFLEQSKYVRCHVLSTMETIPDKFVVGLDVKGGDKT